MSAGWQLTWAQGAARIIPTAGMLLDASFNLPSGRIFAPFAKADWATGDAADKNLTGHMRWLGGMFACLPFGEGGPASAIAPAWNSPEFQTLNKLNHGFSGNADWFLIKAAPGLVHIGLDYPAEDAISRIEMAISGDPQTPALDFETKITARRDCKTSFGFHPILTLAAPPESIEIRAHFRAGYTYPARVKGGGMVCKIGAQFDDLRTIPAADGSGLDLSRLPKLHAIEDNLQLCGLSGPVEIIYHTEGAGVRIDWDRSILPSCQIWISDRALRDPPWAGRYRGLGIEPVASAFDLSSAYSASKNPIADAGFATALTLRANESITTKCKIATFEIAVAARTLDSFSTQP
jgi:hypothetical protein